MSGQLASTDSTSGIVVTAADDDDLLDAADDRQHALGIQPSHVTGAQPAAVVKRVAGRLGVAPVLGHDGRALHEHLALLPGWHRRAVGSGDPHPAVRGVPACRGPQPVGVSEWDDRHDRHRLGEAVVLEHAYAALRPGREHVLAHDRGAGDHAAQARQIGVVPARM